MLRTTTEFNESVMMLFSSHPEAWRKFEAGLREIAMGYAKGAVSAPGNMQQQLLGKFDNCFDLADLRTRLEAAE